MMSPLLMEKLAECMHAERLADAEATRRRQHLPAQATPRRRPRFATVGAAMTCLAAVAGAVIVLGGVPRPF